MEKWLSLRSVAGPKSGVLDRLLGSRNEFSLAGRARAAQGLRLQCRFVPEDDARTAVPQVRLIRGAVPCRSRRCQSQSCRMGINGMSAGGIS
jgi:hypothetical protein